MSASETKSLISENIKKNIRVARNSQLSNSPKTEKLTTKSCSKTSRFHESTSQILNQFFNSPIKKSNIKEVTSAKRPVSNLEKS